MNTVHGKAPQRQETPMSMWNKTLPVLGLSTTNRHTATTHWTKRTQAPLEVTTTTRHPAAGSIRTNYQATMATAPRMKQTRETLRNKKNTPTYITQIWNTLKQQGTGRIYKQHHCLVLYKQTLRSITRVAYICVFLEAAVQHSCTQ